MLTQSVHRIHMSCSLHYYIHLVSRLPFLFLLKCTCHIHTWFIFHYNATNVCQVLISAKFYGVFPLSSLAFIIALHSLWVTFRISMSQNLGSEISILYSSVTFDSEFFVLKFKTVNTIPDFFFFFFLYKCIKIQITFWNMSNL